MKLSYIACLLMAGGASTSELIAAKRMSQSLDTRATFYGGWPIAAASCPSNTISCGDGSCCPSTSDCYTQGLAGVAVCCPDTNNCANTANTLPVCADSSWTLYIGNYFYFCCASGQIGILPNKGSSVAAGLCVDDSVSPPASVRATPYGAASPTLASSSSGIPSVTSTPPLSTTSPTSTSISLSSNTGLTSTAKPSTNGSPTSMSLSTSASSSSTASAASSTSAPSNSTPGSTSHTGAIAGGVVGGVIVLALIFLAIWFFRSRRRRHRATRRAERSDAAGAARKDASVRDQELTEIPGPMAGNFGYSEMPVTEVSPSKGYNEMAVPGTTAEKEGNLKPARMPPAELA